MSAQENTVTPLADDKREEVTKLLDALASLPAEYDREKAAIFFEGMLAGSALAAPKASA